MSGVERQKCQDLSLYLLCSVSFQVEELKSRLTEAEKQTVGAVDSTRPVKRNSLLSNGLSVSAPEKPLHHSDYQKAESAETQMSGSPVPAPGVIVCF